MSSQIFPIPSNNDKTLILDTRASFIQPFKAINWTDLRLSVMYSLTAQSANDQQTGLAETIGAGEDVNQVYIGFKSSDGLLPPSTNFFGVSSQKAIPDSTNTRLIDSGIYLNAYNFDRNGNDAIPYVFASNGTSKTNGTVGQASPAWRDSTQPQYATLLILQMLRNDPTLPVVQQLNVGANAGVQPWTGTFYSDTTIPTVRSLTASFTPYVTMMGPFTFAAVPDALYFYWPFNNSRLRIHSYVLEKYA